MAATFGAATNSGSGSSLTTNRPGTQGECNGALILLQIINYDSAGVVATGPSGFSLVKRERRTTGNILTVETWAKIGGAAEPATYSFTNDEFVYSNVNAIRVDGPDTTTPVDFSTGANGNSTTVTWTGGTIARNGSLVVAIHGGFSQPVATPTGFDSRINAQDGVNDVDTDDLNAGSLSNFTANQPGSDSWVAVVVVVQPPAASVPTGWGAVLGAVRPLPRPQIAETTFRPILSTEILPPTLSWAPEYPSPIARAPRGQSDALAEPVTVPSAPAFPELAWAPRWPSPAARPPRYPGEAEVTPVLSTQIAPPALAWAPTWPNPAARPWPGLEESVRPAITPRGVQFEARTTSENAAVDRPGTQAECQGKGLVLIVMGNSAGTGDFTITPPASFDLAHEEHRDLGSNFHDRIAVYTKYGGPSEPATYTPSVPGAAFRCVMIRASGVDGGDPVDVVSGANNGTPIGGNVVVPGVTVARDGSLGIFTKARHEGTSPQPTGWSNLVKDLGGLLDVASKPLDVGATGDVTAPQSSGQWLAALVVLQPPDPNLTSYQRVSAEVPLPPRRGQWGQSIVAPVLSTQILPPPLSWAPTWPSPAARRPLHPGPVVTAPVLVPTVPPLSWAPMIYARAIRPLGNGRVEIVGPVFVPPPPPAPPLSWAPRIPLVPMARLWLPSLQWQIFAPLLPQPNPPPVLGSDTLAIFGSITTEAVLVSIETVAEYGEMATAVDFDPTDTGV